MGMRSVARRVVLPERLTRFAARRLSEFGGAGLALIGLATILALASYDRADPSLNTATADPPANLIGAPGAWTADLLLQSIGLAGGLVAVVCIAWGWRI